MEFGVFIPKGWASLNQHLPRVLEDAENGVPDMDRPTLHRMFERSLALKADIEFFAKQIKQRVKQNEACSQLMDMEGIGPIGAVLIFVSFGTGIAFLNGREFSAYIGLPPKQYSRGGKTQIVGISRYLANRRLRAVLIQGARAYIYKLEKAETAKPKWILALIQRAGYSRRLYSGTGICCCNRRSPYTNRKV